MTELPKGYRYREPPPPGTLRQAEQCHGAAEAVVTLQTPATVAFVPEQIKHLCATHHALALDKIAELEAEADAQMQKFEADPNVGVRDAGDPLAFRTRFFDEGLETAAVVPCRGCRECCYHPNVYVDPEREPPENLARLDFERRGDGNWYLRRREDGACVHLGPEGCTFYQHRPQACRSYDCRWFELFGARDDSFDDGHTPPLWKFHPTTAEGHAFLTVCLMLGAVQRAHWEDCGGG